MRTRFCNRQVEFKLPEELEAAATEIARKHMMSRSAYCRQALIEKLQRDGIDPMRDKP